MRTPPCLTAPAQPFDRLQRNRIGSMQAYPTNLIRYLTLTDGTTIKMRPIRPEDAAIEQDFVRNLSDESRYFRFMLRLMQKLGFHMSFDAGDSRVMRVEINLSLGNGK